MFILKLNKVLYTVGKYSVNKKVIESRCFFGNCHVFSSWRPQIVSNTLNTAISERLCSAKWMLLTRIILQVFLSRILFMKTAVWKGFLVEIRQRFGGFLVIPIKFKGAGCRSMQNFKEIDAYFLGMTFSFKIVTCSSTILNNWATNSGLFRFSITLIGCWVGYIMLVTFWIVIWHRANWYHL